MTYSDYDIEELNKYKNYKVICDKFISLANNDKTKEKLESILYQGGYNDYNPNGGIGKNNEIIDIERRISLAYLLVRNEESFDQIVNNNVVYFHGTNANALPGILTYGINSMNKSTSQGVEVTTGEDWSRIKGRDFISFTDILDIAEDYSCLSSNKDSELSFPIVLGTTKENLQKTRIVGIKSDVPEVGVYENFPKELITCIMVPSSKKEIVKKMVGEDMLVLSMDGVLDKFYSVEYDLYDLYIDEEKYHKIKNGISDDYIELDGIKESVFGRVLNNMKRKIELLRNPDKGVGIDERNITR